MCAESADDDEANDHYVQRLEPEKSNSEKIESTSCDFWTPLSIVAVYFCWKDSKEPSYLAGKFTS